METGPPGGRPRIGPSGPFAYFFDGASDLAASPVALVVVVVVVVVVFPAVGAGAGVVVVVSPAAFAASGAAF